MTRQMPERTPRPAELGRMPLSADARKDQTMKLKIVTIEGKTYAEVQDDKPVYVDDSGKDVAFDAPHAASTISRLNGEAKGHREAKEAAEATLKKFEGITDPAAALSALKTIQNLDDKKLVDAGEVEKVKAAAIAAVEEKYKPVVEERDGLKNALHSEKIGGSFARSKFIAEKMAVPGPMVEATFGKHFAIDGGKLVAKDANGNQIYSKSRPGEPADFDEALEALVETSPFRDNVLKGRQQSGGGANGGGGSGAGAKTMTRDAFNQLNTSDPKAAAARMAEGYTLTE